MKVVITYMDGSSETFSDVYDLANRDGVLKIIKQWGGTDFVNVPLTSIKKYEVETR